MGASKSTRQSTRATALLFSVEVNRTFSVDVGKSEADLEPNRVGIFGVEGAQTVLRCHQVVHQRE